MSDLKMYNGSMTILCSTSYSYCLFLRIACARMVIAVLTNSDISVYKLLIYNSDCFYSAKAGGVMRSLRLSVCLSFCL